MSRNHTRALEVTIPSGTALTGTERIDGYKIVAIQMPSAWTAAALTFQAKAREGADLAELYDGNTVRSETVAVDRYIQLATPIQAQSVRVRSGTSGTPVNQAADRILTLFLGAE